jgi:hypothetical protein
MRKLIQIGGVLVVFGVLLFFGAQLLFTQEATPIRPTRPAQLSQMTRTQDTTLRVGSDSLTAQETYVSEVIISAPWGKKNLVYGKEESPPEEFGYHVPKEESPSVGPSTFAVAPNGDIYIVDPLNNRMQRFDSEGHLISIIPTPTRPIDICVGQNNNVYLLRYGWKPEELGDRPGTVGAVLKCDQKGNILNTYPVFTGVAATANFVYCDKFGRIFMACRGMGPYQVGTSTEVFSLGQQKNSEVDGFFGINSAALDKNLFFRARPVFKRPDNLSYTPNVYYAINFDGDTVHVYGVRPGYKFRPGITGGFFGCDEELNIYVGGGKYNANGELVAVCKCECEKPYIEVEARARSRTLDEKGNLYILCEDEEKGLQVIKCHPQKQKGD